MSTLILKRVSSKNMEFLILFLVLTIGLLLGFGIGYWRFGRNTQTNSEELNSMGAKLQVSEAKIKDSQERINDLEQVVGQKEAEIKEISEARIRFEQESVHLKQSLQEQKRVLEETEKRMLESFSFAAQKALEGNTEKFVDMAKNMMSKESESIKGNLDSKQLKLENLINPVKESLERYQKVAQDMEVERQKSYTLVEKELRQLAETGLKLTKETEGLKNALKKPHVRGRWGEVQLKNCIELAGMSEYSDVSFQDSSEVDGKVLRPDMIVRMPGGRVVVVDAKTPIDAFLAAMDAQTEEEQSIELARHGQHVKDHIKKLSQKAYQDHVASSADFTVMFLPNESFLYAALETQRDLVEYALEKKILVATPPTLIGLLKVIRYGWNENKLAKNAQIISEAGQELHKRIVDFVEAYLGVGKHLDKAKLEYETGLKRLNSRVLVQARKMEGLGAKGTKELPSDLGYESEQKDLDL